MWIKKRIISWELHWKWHSGAETWLASTLKKILPLLKRIFHALGRLDPLHTRICMKVHASHPNLTRIEKVKSQESCELLIFFQCALNLYSVIRIRWCMFIIESPYECDQCSSAVILNVEIEIRKKILNCTCAMTNMLQLWGWRNVQRRILWNLPYLFNNGSLADIFHGEPQNFQLQ